MVTERVFEKVEHDVNKEEQWLLREISFLEEFNNDINELVELHEKLTEFQSAAQTGKLSSLQKKLLALQELVHKDEHKFKKFKRVLARGERRRVRYEHRVFGRIGMMEQSLDQPTKKELDTLVEHIHVFSARILTELSWQVGKIMELSSQNQPDIPAIKKHLDETLESSKALVALLEKLKQFMQVRERQLQGLKSAHAILPQYSGLSGYLKDGAIKTAFLRSIPELKEILEKMWVSHFTEEYLKILENKKPELSKVLTLAEIDQLKDCPGLSSKGTFLFLPGFRRVVLAFNIDKIPSFQQPGWLFTGLMGGNLEKIGSSGLLSSPLESVLRHKHYYSWKAWKNSSDEELTDRLSDGISFAFQNYNVSRGYCFKPKITWGAILKHYEGGFFIFPIRTVLKEGIILDFSETMDGGSEIILIDPSYRDKKALEITSKLLRVLRGQIELPIFYDSFNPTSSLTERAPLSPLKHLDYFLKLFKEIKKNPFFLEKLYQLSKKSDFNNFDIIEEKGVLGISYLPSRHDNNQIFVPLSEDSSLLKLLKFIKSDWNRDQLLLLSNYCKEDNFTFFYMVLIYYQLFFNKLLGKRSVEEEFLPSFARYSSKETSYLQQKLAGTILQSGMDYLADPEQITFPKLLTLTYLKSKPLQQWRTQTSLMDYVEQMKHLSPKQLKRLIQKTIREISDLLEIIVKQNFRTREPCAVNVNSGILVLTPSFCQERGHDVFSLNSIKVIERYVNRGVPVFGNFDNQGHEGKCYFDFNESKLDFFFSKVVPLKNLPINPNKYGKYGEESYFYLKDGKLRIHLRRSNKDYSLD